MNFENNGLNFQLTSGADGVSFDINGTGTADRIAWTSAGSQVAFLTMDRNSNGTIDDGTELFGTATKKRDGSRANHGFDALADLDENGDGRIDAVDSVFQRLMLWVDLNHNGVSESNELTSLDSNGVVSIFTASTESRRHDQFGNQYRFMGTAVVRHGNKNGDQEKKITDVFFARP